MKVRVCLLIAIMGCMGSRGPFSTLEGSHAGSPSPVRAMPMASRLPSRIAVAYVDEPGFERLWNVFGHAVSPIPLRHPDWTWPKGRHWRHEIETVNGVLRHALAAAEANVAEALRLRLEAHRAEEMVPLLPGRNFHLYPERRLVERFRSFMSGDRCGRCRRRRSH